MVYLPRICEHCLNPACVASCPSGAMYKREEDGDRACQPGRLPWLADVRLQLPLQEAYFNWATGKAEKCTLCYPRIEVGLPTVCSETCVRRIRYLGLVLYDADRVEEAASTSDITSLLETQLGIFLDPCDRAIQTAARRDGIPHEWIEAAQRSPVWALAMKYRIALPLHPEYRTLPMVWYVPPLSPMTATIEGVGPQADPDRRDPDDVFAAIESLRIPTRRDTELADAVGMSGADIEDMFRLLAIADYKDRFVVPTAHRELAEELSQQHQGACGLRTRTLPARTRSRQRPQRHDRTREQRRAQYRPRHRRCGPSERQPATCCAQGTTCTRTPAAPIRTQGATMTAYKLISLLLCYPDPELHALRGEIAAAALELTDSEGRAIVEFLQSTSPWDLEDAQQAYVQTFDFNRRASLYMTYA